MATTFCPEPVFCHFRLEDFIRSHYNAYYPNDINNALG
jgi:hypothetical protein